MNTHFHACVRHLNIQWNKNIQTECYVLLSELQTKCYTSSAQEKKHDCHVQWTRSQVADSATTKRKDKNVFFFSSWTNFAEGDYDARSEKTKELVFFPNTKFAEHASTKGEAWFFWCYSSNSDRISQKEHIQNAKRKFFFVFFFKLERNRRRKHQTRSAKFFFVFLFQIAFRKTQTKTQSKKKFCSFLFFFSSNLEEGAD